VDQISDTMADHVNDPCKSWGSMMNSSLDTFGMTAAGEFALAMTDCGLFVNGVNLGTRYEGDYVDPQNPKKKYPPMGSCAPWVNWESWDADMKSAMSGFAHASMDALQNWFFWTWKIGNSTVSGTIEAPAWSYQLGLQQGWIPQDPRSALGTCNNTAPRAGGAIPKGTGVADAATASFPWPPTSISAGGAASLLPTYTPTSALVTLPAPTPMAVSGGPTPTASANAGNGWNNPSDTAQMMVAIPTCSYLDPWVDPSTDPPSPLCGGSSRRSEYVPPHAPRAVVTPPPHA
jgi:glucan 1,3-beta-glucosidase